MEQTNQNLPRLNEDEIDLADLLRQMWAGRWIIGVTTVLFLVAGALYSFYTSSVTVKEYETSVTLLVESPSPDSLITVTKSPLFISEVLKIKLNGLKPGAPLTVAEALDQLTSPPQGNLAGLTARINATKGNAGIVLVAVKMQDPNAARQLADSVVQKLTRFQVETQIKRAEKSQKTLAEDTSKTFQVLRETTTRNLLYLSKGTSKNIQYQAEGSSKELQYLTKGSAKTIEFQRESVTKNIEFLNEGSAKNIQFLTDGYHKAETIYLQSQQALADCYTRNSKTPGSIDSLEVKRLNADIKLKYNVYSGLYQQLESTKIEAKKQTEQVKLDANKQIEQAKLDADKQLEQAKLNADKQLGQAKLDADKQLDQARLEAEKQFEQKKNDAQKQIEQVALDAEKKIPAINVLEPAPAATLLNATNSKKVMLLMGFFGIIVGVGIVFGKKFWEKNFKGTT